MQARWNVYCFDYARYLELRPRLRSAATADAFAVLAEGPEGEAIAQAVLEQTLTPEEARNALVIALCCVGDPLPLDATFPRFLRCPGPSERSRGRGGGAGRAGQWGQARRSVAERPGWHCRLADARRNQNPVSLVCTTHESARAQHGAGRADGRAARSAGRSGRCAGEFRAAFVQQRPTA